MKKAHIVTRKWGDRRKGKTDWSRVDALTDEDIAKAVANDPDAVPIDIDWSDAVLRSYMHQKTKPKKRA